MVQHRPLTAVLMRTEERHVLFLYRIPIVPLQVVVEEEIIFVEVRRELQSGHQPVTELRVVQFDCAELVRLQVSLHIFI